MKKKEIRFIPFNDKDLPENIRWKKEIVAGEDGYLVETGRKYPVYASEHVLQVIDDENIIPEVQYHGVTDFALHNSYQEIARRVLEEGNND